MILFTKKRVAVGALMAAILFSSMFALCQPAQANNIKDLDKCADYAKPAVERLTQNSIIYGDEKGYFNPQQNINRAQIITLLVKALDMDQISPEHTDTFKDVPHNHWANKYVEIAFQNGITRGIASDQFGVNQNCTREQMTTMFVNTFRLLDEDLSDIPYELTDLSTYTDEALISDWARDSVAFAVHMGLISGTSATTLSPRAGAERQQVAVLTDRFISKKASIVTDMQAQRILENAMKAQFDGQGISNISEFQVQVNLWNPTADLPAEFSYKARVTNEMLWPASLHQLIKLEMVGLPSSNYPPYEMEQYLMGGVIYEKILDGNNNASWVNVPRADTPDLGVFMQAIKDAQTAQLLVADQIHKSVNVKIEDAEVNGGSGKIISYDGQITDLSALLDQVLPAALPGTIGSSDFRDFLDTINTSIKSIRFSEIYHIGADGLTYGTQFEIRIECNTSANYEDFPVKSIVINSSSSDYKYNNINIVLPAGAKNAGKLFF